MRALHPFASGDLTDTDLDSRYAFPARPTVRMLAVQTLDGAAAGPDHRSSSINNAADKRVYDANRRCCDAVVVGAATAQAENYRTIDPAAENPRVLVLLSSRGQVPKAILESPGAEGRTLLVTGSKAHADALEKARSALGAPNVIELAGHQPEPAHIIDALHERGHHRILCEGGPRIFSTWLAAGVVTELALTHTPLMVGSDAPRVTNTVGFWHEFQLLHLLEEHGTLLTRWQRARAN